MAMIKCADCNADISSNADHCLHCGSKAFNKIAVQNAKLKDAWTTKGALIGGLIPFVVALIYNFGMIFREPILALIIAGYYGVIFGIITGLAGGVIGMWIGNSKRTVQ